MKNQKTTSSKIASLASHILKDSGSSSIAKSLAGSALSQVTKHNETGKHLEHLASNVLNSEKYSNETKKLAASILSQSNKTR